MTVIVGAVEFDAKAAPVIVGWIEFDCYAPEPVQSVIGGRGRSVRSSTPSAKSSPAPASSRYHGNAYEQAELAAAAELADEETVLTFILELAHFGIPSSY